MIPARSALLLVDFQHDFLADDGRMPVARHQVAPLVAETNRAIAAARENGADIVAIGNEFDPNDRLMNLLRRGAAVKGTSGAAWDERVPIDGLPYFAKTRGDAFSNPALRTKLIERGTEEVVITGVMASACVAATARGARAAGLRVTILSRAVADTSDPRKHHALKSLAKIAKIVE